MAQTPIPRARPSRKLRWALGLSLAMNLVVLGLIIGASYRFKDADMRFRGPQTHSYATAYVRALPASERRAFRRSLHGVGGGLPGPAQRRAHFEKVLNALRAENFDAQQVQGVLDTQAEAALGIQKAAQRVWLGKVRDMTVSDRAAYADRLEEILEQRPRAHRKPPRD